MRYMALMRLLVTYVHRKQLYKFNKINHIEIVLYLRSKKLDIYVCISKK